MVRDVPRSSCMCASGEPRLHAGPVQLQDSGRKYCLEAGPWRRGLEKSEGGARRGGDTGEHRLRRPATVVVGRLEALRRDGRVEGSAALLVRLEPELERVRSAGAEAIASGTPP
jgi:hypothetical protein